MLARCPFEAIQPSTTVSGSVAERDVFREARIRVAGVAGPVGQRRQTGFGYHVRHFWKRAMFSAWISPSDPAAGCKRAAEVPDVFALRYEIELRDSLAPRVPGAVEGVDGEGVVLTGTVQTTHQNSGRQRK